jgi:hypothetical protein
MVEVGTVAGTAEKGVIPIIDNFPTRPMNWQGGAAAPHPPAMPLPSLCNPAAPARRYPVATKSRSVITKKLRGL